MAKLKKPADEKLFLLIKNWLGIYLPTEQDASVFTVKNYREALNQYLGFLSDKFDVPLAAVTFEMMNSETLNEYLDHLQKDLNLSKATRNNRLSAIRAFIGYASACDPEYISTAMNVAKIKSQKDDPFSKVDYMSEAAVKAIMQMPNTHTKIGLRDIAILSMIYDTGSRISELLGIRLCDLRINTDTPTVTVLGKGNVIRTIPISKEAMPVLKMYLAKFHPETPLTAETFLFYVEHYNCKQRMCAQTVRDRMELYRAKAKESCPEVPDRIYPHLWRHTRAMHLYQHGMPLELVAQWLGHRNVMTTRIYAYADTEHKRAAIEKAMENKSYISTDEINNSENNAYVVTDEELLKRLYGLK